MPPLLLIYRDFLKPGVESAYNAIEREIARLMRDAGPLTSERSAQFPNAYLGIEPLSGPAEVWFLTAWETMAEFMRVGESYQSAPQALRSALEENSKKRAEITLEPVQLFATHRPALSRGEPWLPGRDRFLVITVTRQPGPFDGTAFEAEDGTRFVIQSARTRAEAESRAAAETRAFAARADWSRPATEWLAADPEFWR